MDTNVLDVPGSVLARARRAVRMVYTHGREGLPTARKQDLDYALGRKLIDPERVEYAENVYMLKRN